MARNLDIGEFRLALKAVDPHIDNQSPFSHEISEDDVMRIRGIASGPDIDLHDDVMAKSVIDSFKDAIEKGMVLENGEWSLIPLRSGHRNNWDDILGWITKAEIDVDYNLWIEAELDDTSRARDLYKKLTTPTRTGRVTQLGFSIGGKIQKYREYFDAGLHKTLRVLEAIALSEVSVVGAPAYPTAYVEAILKSLEKMPDEIMLEDTMADENLVEKNDSVEEAANETVDVVTEHDGNGDEVVTEQPDVIVQTPVVVDTEEVNENESQEAEEATEVADPNADLRESIATLSAALADIQARLDAPAEEEDVNKSAEVVTEETDVTKSAPTFDMDAVKAMFEEAMSDAMTKLTEEITVMKSAINELAATPIDGSLSVLKAKDREENDPLAILKSKVTSDGYNKNNVLADAVAAAYRR